MAYLARFYDVVEEFLPRWAPYGAQNLRPVQEAHRRGEIVLAGALGVPPDRALLVFRTDGPALVDAFARDDPYVTHGLMTRWEVLPWAVVSAMRIGMRAAAERPSKSRSRPVQPPPGAPTCDETAGSCPPVE